MSGTLFVVATPIGNLEDVTLRALRVLREVNLIAAEDTRRTAKLLVHHGIATPTVSFHAHNTKRRLPQLMRQLRSGRSIALVSDAGTPGVSDPGEELVRACINEQITVDPLPGATAPLAAVVASGFPILPLTLYGFSPHRSKDRISWLSELCEVVHTLTFFESPHRIAATLREAAPLFGTRPIVVARELTKVHQELLRGTCEELLLKLTHVRGELTVVVGPKATPRHTEEIDEQLIVAEFWSKTKTLALGRRAAVADLAAKFGIPARKIYAIIEQAKNSGE